MRILGSDSTYETVVSYSRILKIKYKHAVKNMILSSLIVIGKITAAKVYRLESFDHPELVLRMLDKEPMLVKRTDNTHDKSEMFYQEGNGFRSKNGQYLCANQKNEIVTCNTNNGKHKNFTLYRGADFGVLMSGPHMIVAEGHYDNSADGYKLKLVNRMEQGYSELRFTIDELSEYY
ncbi:hypothetical protein ENBRE01_0432 [Enteropsectra breve]|nr:hypothetical protein ENBRE01_0432 [Enteropsectra breve]